MARLLYDLCENAVIYHLVSAPTRIVNAPLYVMGTGYDINIAPSGVVFNVL